MRSWYNGKSVDSGFKRDAGRRLDVVIGKVTTSNYLLSELELSTAQGTSRRFIDVRVSAPLAMKSGRPQ